MKLCLLLLMVFAAPALHAEEGCTANTFCADKISGLSEVLEQRCFLPYLQNAKIDPRAYDQFVFCMHDRAVEWSFGFGRSCAGLAAQDACYKQCVKDGLKGLCLTPCASF